jgi:hypothetical protein
MRRNYRSRVSFCFPQWGSLRSGSIRVGLWEVESDRQTIISSHRNFCHESFLPLFWPCLGSIQRSGQARRVSSGQRCASGRFTDDTLERFRDPVLIQSELIRLQTSPIRAGRARTNNAPSSSAPKMGSLLNGGWLRPKRASTNPNGLIREDERMLHRQVLSWLGCIYCLAQ